MNKKVYFAGSIRGGRVDAALYRSLIAFMQKTDTVLTEHIGNAELDPFEKADDAKIYAIDTAWIRECDLLIAECTCPSLGVGYELAYAEKHGKPCYIFYNKNRANLSAMLAGDPYFTVMPYGSEEELFTAVERILTE